MAQQAKKRLEPPARGYLPGTRPLSVEEYECLATTHPYAVKHLVTKRVASVLCGNVIKRLPATRVPTGMDAANEVEGRKRCSAMENVGRTDTFRMPDEHVEMRCSVAPTSVRKGEATAHCVHTDGRGVDVQSYASPPYSREHQQQRGLAKVVTGPAGEIQLFSKIARFPALKEARRIGLHDVVDDTSPNHYCEEELRQSHLHCFRSVKCTSCSEQELPCQVGFAPLRSVKRSLTVHHPDQDQDSPMVPSTGTSRIRVCEGNLSEGRRSIDSQDSGGCKMGSLSLMVVKCKGGEVSHAICTDHKLPCGNGQEIGDNWIDAECFSYEHYGHDLHREEYNSLSPSKDQEKYRGKYSLNKAGIQDVAFPAIIAFGNEGFFSENTDAESHIQGAHASVPIGLAGHRSDSNSSEQYLLRQRDYTAGFDAKQRGHFAWSRRGASQRKGTEASLTRHMRHPSVPAIRHNHTQRSSSAGLPLKGSPEIFASVANVCIASRTSQSRSHAGESGRRRLGWTASRTEEEFRRNGDRESASTSHGMGSMTSLHGTQAAQQRFSSRGLERDSMPREMADHQGGVHLGRSSREHRSVCGGGEPSRDSCGGSQQRMTAAGERGTEVREGGHQAETKANDGAEWIGEFRRRTNPEDQFHLRSSGGSSMHNTAFTGTEPTSRRKVVGTSATDTACGGGECNARSLPDSHGKSASMRRGSTGGVSESGTRRREPNVSDEASNLHQSASSASAGLRLSGVREMFGSAGKASSALRSSQSRSHAGESGRRRLGSTASRTEEEFRRNGDRESASTSHGMGSMTSLHGTQAAQQRFSSRGLERDSMPREMADHQGDVHLGRSSREQRSVRGGGEPSRDSCGGSQQRMTAAGERGTEVREGGHQAETKANDGAEWIGEFRRRTNPEDQFHLRSSGGSSMHNTAFTGTEPTSHCKAVGTSATSTACGGGECNARSLPDSHGKSASMRRGSTGGVSEEGTRRREPNVSDEASNLRQSASSASAGLRLSGVREMFGSAGKASSASRSSQSRSHAGESGRRRLGSTASRTEEEFRRNEDRESASTSHGMGSMTSLHGTQAAQQRFSSRGLERDSMPREMADHQGDVHLGRSSREQRSVRGGGETSRDSCGGSRQRMTAAGERGTEVREGGHQAETKANDGAEWIGEFRRRTNPEDQFHLRSSGGSSMHNTAFTGTEPTSHRKVVGTSATDTACGGGECNARSLPDSHGKSASMRRGSTGGVSESGTRRREPNVSDEASNLRQSASSASAGLRLSGVREMFGSAGKASSASRSSQSRSHAGESGHRRLGSTASRTEEEFRRNEDRESASTSHGMGSMTSLHGTQAAQQRLSSRGLERDSMPREMADHQGDVHLGRSSREQRSVRGGGEPSRDSCGGSQQRMTAAGERGTEVREGGHQAETKANDGAEWIGEFRRRTNPEDQFHLRSSGGSSMHNTAFSGTEPTSHCKAVGTSATSTACGGGECNARSLPDSHGKSASMRRGSTGGVSESGTRRREPNVSDEASNLRQSASGASGGLRLSGVREMFDSAGKASSALRSSQSRSHAGESGRRRLGSTASRTEEEFRRNEDRESASTSHGMGSMTSLHGTQAAQQRFSSRGIERDSMPREMADHQGDVHLGRSSREQRSVRGGGEPSRDSCGGSRQRMTAAGERGTEVREGGHQAETKANDGAEWIGEFRRRTNPEDQFHLRSSGGSSMHNTAFTGTEPTSHRKVVGTSATDTACGGGECNARSLPDSHGKSASMRRGSTGGVSESGTRRREPNVSDEASNLRQSASSASAGLRLSGVREMFGSAGKAPSASRSSQSRSHAGESGRRRLGSTASRTEEEFRRNEDRESASTSHGMGSMTSLHGTQAAQQRLSSRGLERDSMPREMADHQGDVHLGRSSREQRSVHGGGEPSRDSCGSSQQRMTAAGERGTEVREGGHQAETKANDGAEWIGEFRRRTNPEDQFHLRSSGGSSMHNTAFTGTEPTSHRKVVGTSATSTACGGGECNARSLPDSHGKSASMRRGSTGGVSESGTRRREPNVSDEASNLRQSASSASAGLRLSGVREMFGSAGKASSASRSSQSRSHAGESGRRRLGSTASRTEEEFRRNGDRESASTSHGMGSMTSLHGTQAAQQRFSSRGLERDSMPGEMADHQGDVHLGRSSREQRSVHGGGEPSRDSCGGSQQRMTAAGERGTEVREGGHQAETKANDGAEWIGEFRRRTNPEDQFHLRSSGGSSMHNTAFTGTEPASHRKVVGTSATSTACGGGECNARSLPDSHGKSASMRRGSTGGVSEERTRRREPNVSDEASNLRQSASSASAGLRLSGVREMFGSAGKASSASRSSQSRSHAGESGRRRLGSTASRTEEEFRRNGDRESASTSHGMGSMTSLHGTQAAQQRFSSRGLERDSMPREMADHQGDVHLGRSSREQRSVHGGGEPSRDSCGGSQQRMTAAGERGTEVREGGHQAETKANDGAEWIGEFRRRTNPEDQFHLRSSGGSSMHNTAFTGTEPASHRKVVGTSATSTACGGGECNARSLPDSHGKSASMRRGSTGGVSEERTRRREPNVSDEASNLRQSASSASAGLRLSGVREMFGSAGKASSASRSSQSRSHAGESGRRRLGSTASRTEEEFRRNGDRESASTSHGMGSMTSLHGTQAAQQRFSSRGLERDSMPGEMADHQGDVHLGRSSREQRSVHGGGEPSRDSCGGSQQRMTAAGERGTEVREGGHQAETKANDGAEWIGEFRRRTNPEDQFHLRSSGGSSMHNTAFTGTEPASHRKVVGTSATSTACGGGECNARSLPDSHGKSASMRRGSTGGVSEERTRRREPNVSDEASNLRQSASSASAGLRLSGVREMFGSAGKASSASRSSQSRSHAGESGRRRLGSTASRTEEEFRRNGDRESASTSHGMGSMTSLHGTQAAQQRFSSRGLERDSMPGEMADHQGDVHLGRSSREQRSVRGGGEPSRDSCGGSQQRMTAAGERGTEVREGGHQAETKANDGAEWTGEFRRRTNPEDQFHLRSSGGSSMHNTAFTGTEPTSHRKVVGTSATSTACGGGECNARSLPDSHGKSASMRRGSTGGVSEEGTRRREPNVSDEASNLRQSASSASAGLRLSGVREMFGSAGKASSASRSSQSRSHAGESGRRRLGSTASRTEEEFRRNGDRESASTSHGMGSMTSLHGTQAAQQRFSSRGLERDSMPGEMADHRGGVHLGRSSREYRSVRGGGEPSRDSCGGSQQRMTAAGERGTEVREGGHQAETKANDGAEWTGEFRRRTNPEDQFHLRSSGGSSMHNTAFTGTEPASHLKVVGTSATSTACGGGECNARSLPDSHGKSASMRRGSTGGVSEERTRRREPNVSDEASNLRQSASSASAGLRLSGVREMFGSAGKASSASRSSQSRSHAGESGRRRLGSTASRTEEEFRRNGDRESASTSHGMGSMTSLHGTQAAQQRFSSRGLERDSMPREMADHQGDVHLGRSSREHRSVHGGGEPSRDSCGGSQQRMTAAGERGTEVREGGHQAETKANDGAEWIGEFRRRTNPEDQFHLRSSGGSSMHNTAFTGTEPTSHRKVVGTSATSTACGGGECNARSLPDSHGKSASMRRGSTGGVSESGTRRREPNVSDEASNLRQSASSASAGLRLSGVREMFGSAGKASSASRSSQSRSHAGESGRRRLGSTASRTEEEFRRNGDRESASTSHGMGSMTSLHGTQAAQQRFSSRGLERDSMPGEMADHQGGVHLGRSSREHRSVRGGGEPSRDSCGGSQQRMTAAGERGTEVREGGHQAETKANDGAEWIGEFRRRTNPEDQFHLRSSGGSSMHNTAFTGTEPASHRKVVGTSATSTACGGGECNARSLPDSHGKSASMRRGSTGGVSEEGTRRCEPNVSDEASNLRQSASSASAGLRLSDVREYSMPRGVADHQGKKQFDEFPLRSSRGFSFQLTGELEGDCGKTNAQTRTESALFESCQSSTAAQEAVRERPLATGPQASAQESVDLLLEQRSVKLSESNAFDGQAFYSLSKSENLESVLQSAVSTKLAQHLRYCSGRDSMVWRHSKQGGDVSLHSTENMTATRVGGVRTPICTQKASARYVKPGSQATAFSESTAVQQKQYYVPLEVEAVSDVSRRPRLYDKQVGGKCTNFAHDGSGNRSSSSIPSKGSRNHRNTELRYASELESFPNRNIARSSGPDVPTREFHSDKPRDSSVPDKGGNAPKRPLDSNSTFGSTAEISSSRRSSTGDLSPNILGSRDRSQATHHARGHFGKSRIDTAAPTAFITRPSYMDTTAVGRRLTAQNNMWSAVGSYEPLASLVFHELYRQLSPALQALCMQCLRTTDSPELRALTDIQQAAMKLVADQSVRRSAAAKKRLAEVFKRAGQPKGTLECLEQFLLTRAPILIYFDIVSLTPHLEQGGFIRSHFEIPQTDATYLRKCNEREQALYSGLYEHESVRPEHHPKYGYVSVNCKLQPPWEPQPGEACIILKDHVRVRATISASQSDGSGVLSFGHEPLVATLNNPWHVLEALGHEALAALANELASIEESVVQFNVHAFKPAFAREPTTLKGTDTAALVDCNIHGEVKLGKDVEAIVLPKSAARDKGTFTKLQEIATQYMVPILSMEKCPTAVKDDCWKHTMRHLQHEVLLKKTALGNTYGQI